MSQVKCNACDGIFSDKGIVRHIKSCIKQKYGVKTIDKISENSTLLIRVQAKYEHQYFLFLMVDNCVLLSELDRFLRDIWLECCGHLSGFTIDNERYYSHVESSSDQDMFIELGEVLYKGLEFTYTYDFGSSTDLQLQVVGIYEPISKEKGIHLIARNQLPEYQCNSCNKKAQFSFTDYYEGTRGIVCASCKKRLEEEDGYEEAWFIDMPNSPRMNVCGYEGPADDIMFIKHGCKNKIAKKKRAAPKQADTSSFVDMVRSGNYTADDLRKNADFHEALSKIMKMSNYHSCSQSLPTFMVDGTKLQGRSLTACLEGLRKNELDVIRKSLQITSASNLKKNDLVRLLSNHIIGNIDEILAVIPYPEYQEIINISKVDGTYINQPDESEEVPYPIDELRRRGLLFTVFNYSDRCGLLIPDDIKKLITNVSNDSSFISRRNLTRKINESLLCLFYYWGVAEKFPLMKETALLLETPMDDSFIALFNRVFEFMCPCMISSEKIGSIQYYYMFSSEPAYQVISSSWQNSSYPAITREMVEPASDGQLGLILDNPYYLELLNLMKEAGIDKEVDGEEQIFDTIFLLAQSLSNGKPGITARHIAKDLGFEIDLRKAPAVEELINNMIKYTPNYWLKGNTLSGLFRYGARSSMNIDADKPSDSSMKEDKKSATGIAASRWSVGRNDPCPCGSGKKYKKCCLSE